MTARFVIVESANAARLFSDACAADDLAGLERLHRLLREDTRLIANAFRGFGFNIINCAGINVTAYSANPLARDDTVADSVGDLTRTELGFCVGLGRTLSEAFAALGRELAGRHQRGS